MVALEAQRSALEHSTPLAGTFVILPGLTVATTVDRNTHAVSAFGHANMAGAIDVEIGDRICALSKAIDCRSSLTDPRPHAAKSDKAGNRVPRTI